MKRTKETRKWKIPVGSMVLRGILVIALVCVCGLLLEPFAMESHAESAAKVTTTANIRKSPDKSSEAIASAEKDKVISIRSQVKGSDGYTWYQIFVDSNTLGYIRGDMVQITDGSTPPEESSLPAVGGGTTAPTTAPNGGGTAATPTPPPAQTQAPNVTSADVTVLNPVSATVKSSQPVRVRNMPSTNGQIVGSASNGQVVTVNGQAPADSSGKAWYQVTFTDNSKEITGFIREDFLELSEPPTPYVEPTQAPEPTPEPTPEATPEPTPEVTKPYDVRLIGEQWWLVDPSTLADPQPVGWTIDDVLKLIEANKTGGAGSNTQKVIIILLVIFLVAAGGVIAFLVFKIKDMADSAYFNEVENETMNRRRSTAGGQGTRRVMQSVGTDRPDGSRAAQRTAQGNTGGRTTGTSRGTKPTGAPQGTRPTGASQGPRPQGNGQGRPAGAPQGTQRPQGSGQGMRPTGAPQGARPQGSGQGRPAGAPQGTRPQGSGQGMRPTGASQGARPQGCSQGRPAGAPQGPRPQGMRPTGPQSARPRQEDRGWQSRNFMEEEEDEFEFDFLNQDGEE